MHYEPNSRLPDLWIQRARRQFNNFDDHLVPIARTRRGQAVRPCDPEPEGKAGLGLQEGEEL